MTKDSKTTTTIRRKKGKEFAAALQKIREENASPPSPYFSSEEDETAAEAADECYLFHEMVLGPGILRRLMSRDRSLFLTLVVMRCANALLIQTQYVPDEYWQSVEVSHHMAFGYGYKTWEWREGLRGYSYPLVFAMAYKLLHILGLDYRLMLIKFPRILQAVLAAYGDFRLYKLSSQLSGRSTAQWTLLCQMLSWFSIYCMPRTLSNSTETVLVTAALSYFPWPGIKRKRGDVYKCLALAAVSVVVRPTAAVIWVLVCSFHLQTVYGTSRFPAMVKAYLTVGLVSLCCSAIVDRVWYEEWVCVQFNFLRFNVLSGQAAMYGTHPWHWYFTQGVAVVFGTHLVPFLLGGWRSRNKALLWVVVWIVAIHSFLPHKEFRFILPALPLAMHYCGEYFHDLCQPPTPDLGCDQRPGEGEGRTEETMQGSGGTNASKDGNRHDLEETDKLNGPAGDADRIKDSKGVGGERHRENLTKARVCVGVLAVTNVVAALYTCLIHQRGTVMVTKYIADAADANTHTDVLFLMPCHSTPYYSYLHRNISLRFLTCEPNLLGMANHTQEVDTFYSDPVPWLLKEYTQGERALPTQVVLFSSLQPAVQPWLDQGGYATCDQFFHTHFPEGRVGASVLVACR